MEEGMDRWESGRRRAGAIVQANGGFQLGSAKGEERGRGGEGGAAHDFIGSQRQVFDFLPLHLT